MGDHDISWRNLTRAQQKALARVFGGGTLRNHDEETVIGLRLSGLIIGETISDLGLEVCHEALATLRGRRQEQQI